MKIYLCHQSALAAYRSPAALKRLGRGVQPFDDPGVPDGATAQSIANTLQIPLPLYTLVTTPNKRRPKAGSLCHTWSGPAHMATFIEVLPNVYVSSPEFLFLQIAGRADFENGLMLGYELVGGYALNAQAKGGLIMRPPLATPASLATYLASSASAFGANKAARAARYLLPNARSPKEAEIAALLSLPRRCGGRGIGGIVLNRRIDLPPEGQAIARRSYLVADVFFKQAHLELGYDSDDNHISRAAHESDERRANALGTAGVSYISLTSGQLHDWKTFDSIAHVIAQETKTVFRSTSSSIRERQYKLWQRLLFGNRAGGRTFLG